MQIESHLNLHPVNLIILSGIFQCIILAFILFFFRDGNKLSNRIFSIFMVVCSLNVLWPLIIDTNLEKLFPEIFVIPFSFLLAVGPLQLLYSNSLTIPNFSANKKDLLLFIPLLIELLVQGYFITQAVKLNKFIYDIDGFLFFRIIELTASGASIIFYGGVSIKLIRNHEIWILENFSNRKDITLSWLHKLIHYLRTLWILWLLFELFFIIFWQFEIHYLWMYLLLYTLLGSITYSLYWVGVQSLIKTGSLAEHRYHQETQTESINPYSRLSNSEIDGYIGKLKDFMKNEKLYLHDNLSLRTLAQRLSLDSNLLSYLLNSILGKSFYDYVNELRIEEVLIKLNNPSYKHFKIVEIGYECGFNSKATFNRVFKRVMGKTPTEFREGQFS